MPQDALSSGDDPMKYGEFVIGTLPREERVPNVLASNRPGTMSGLLRRLQVKSKNEFEGEATAWINRDIVPLPPSRRTWGAWSFVGYMATDRLQYQRLVYRLEPAGNRTQLVANGFVGAEWHVGFPVYNRFVWGVFGSFFPLLMRILLSIVWYGVQLVFGGMSVKVVIGAIWPSFYTLKNTLPESAGIE
ncbi:hypothetical protein NUW54_g7386 [Trametes sanguinea]|uniref:Uncharacterized protein n=1 Tax=Trametes sanguinea TaxID=158606 RepID=A0ACC1PMK7_9APHY|nr:hypothetical protein NUW54_g7386 [Trametes sanguinea]